MGTARLYNFMPPSSGRAYTSEGTQREFPLISKEFSKPQRLQHGNCDKGLIVALFSVDAGTEI